MTGDDDDELVFPDSPGEPVENETGRPAHLDMDGSGERSPLPSQLSFERATTDEGDEGSPQPSGQPSNELASTDSRIEGSLRPSEVATTAPSSPPASMHEQSPLDATPTTSTAPEDGPAPQTPNDAHNADDDSDNYERLNVTF